MILLEAPTQNIYLHCARNWEGKPRYLVVYGLEVSRYETRREAVRGFSYAVDHAEECETGHRPIHGSD